MEELTRVTLGLVMLGAGLCLGMAGVAWQDKAWRGRARRGLARQGLARPGWAWLGWARHVWERLGGVL